jgi:hypothetical protein
MGAGRERPAYGGKWPGPGSRSICPSWYLPGSGWPPCWTANPMRRPRWRCGTRRRQNTEEAVSALRRIPVHMSYNVTALDREGQRSTVYLAPSTPLMQ